MTTTAHTPRRDEQPCPECGRSPGHLLGCPNLPTAEPCAQFIPGPSHAPGQCANCGDPKGWHAPAPASSGSDGGAREDGAR